MSEIIILNGCIDMFEERSMKRIETAPNQRAAVVLKPKLPEFGNRHITITATIVPKIRYGSRRPPSFGAQVRSEK